MAHELAVALQQASRIRQRCTLKESYINVRREYIDIAKGRISQTCSRAAIMEKLPDFVSAFSHHLKPLLRDGSQFTCLLLHPAIDGRITLDSALQSKQFRSCSHGVLEFPPSSRKPHFPQFHGIAETFVWRQSASNHKLRDDWRKVPRSIELITLQKIIAQ